MFENTSKRSLTGAFAVLAAVFVMIAAFALVSTPSQADTFQDGDATTPDLSGTTIQIAPGFKYTYTLMFDETLNDGVEVSYLTGLENGVDSAGITVTPSKNVSGSTWGTVTVNIPNDCDPGQYNLVLKATHAESGQTAYQWIIFKVNAGVSFTPSDMALQFAVANEEYSQEFTVTSGFGNIDSLSVTSDAFSVDVTPTTGAATSTFTVTGVPTTTGAHTITITGETSEGEPINATYTFTVYSQLSESFSGETIGTTDGTSDASTQETIPSDLNVTWTTEDSIEGVSLDGSTGVVTVNSTSYINDTMTITATDSITGQTATKVITIQNEATNAGIQIDADTYLVDGTFYTYVDAGARTLTVSPTLVADSTFSGIASWDVSGDDTVVTMNNGTVTITAPSAAAASAQYTISAVTEFGKTIQTTFNLVVEGDLSVSSGESVRLINTEGQNAYTAEFTASAENATLSYSEQNSNDGELTATLNSGEGSVAFSAHTSGETYTYTLTVTTLGGQSEQIVYTVNTYALLQFDSIPSNGTVAIAV